MTENRNAEQAAGEAASGGRLHIMKPAGGNWHAMGCPGCAYDEGFAAGAASRQGEVDELYAELSRLRARTTAWNRKA